MAEELTRKCRKCLEEFISPFQVRPEQKVTLPGDFDPAFKGGLRKARIQAVSRQPSGKRS